MSDGGKTNEELTGIRRRRVPRRIFETRLGLLIGGKYSIGRSFEIGEGGMLITCDQKLSADQKLVITFRIPGAGQTVVRGIVRYFQPNGTRYGVEFLNLDFNMKRAIRTFVASKTADEAVLKAS